MRASVVAKPCARQALVNSPPTPGQNKLAKISHQLQQPPALALPLYPEA